MIELTAEQIAEGWIAHDGSGMPEHGNRVSILFRDGKVQDNDGYCIRNLWDFSRAPRDKSCDIVAYRILGQSPAAPRAEKAAPATDPNAAMIAADNPNPHTYFAVNLGWTTWSKVADRPIPVMTEEQARLVALLGGTAWLQQRIDEWQGKLAPAAKPGNLLTVADIPRNGFSVWGA